VLYLVVVVTAMTAGSGLARIGEPEVGVFLLVAFWLIATLHALILAVPWRRERILRK
jgi:hypothetical protein